MFSLRNYYGPDRRQSFNLSEFNPRSVGYFSVNGNREYSEDASQLKYYYPVSKREGNIVFDLNQGIESAIHNDYGADIFGGEKMDNILRWIKNNSQGILADSETGKWISPDFVMNRGLMSKIMSSSADEKNEEWTCSASMFRGTIYICLFKTEAQADEIRNRSEERKKWISRGFKFEQCMTTEDPSKPPNLENPVNEAEEFSSIFQSFLDKKSILYSAEIDGAWSEKQYDEPLPIDDIKFVEIKTVSLKKKSRKKYSNFSPRDFYTQYVLRYRHCNHCKWWCQSYLVGIDTIVCGVNDKNNRIPVDAVVEFDISALVENRMSSWSPEKCMKLLNNFLDFVRENVSKDWNEAVYLFRRIQGEDEIRVTEKSPGDQFAFLPPWFTGNDGNRPTKPEEKK